MLHLVGGLCLLGLFRGLAFSATCLVCFLFGLDLLDVTAALVSWNAVPHRAHDTSHESVVRWHASG